ncbi:hypothetical protein [Siphonobacter sp. SORGH_AS_1065]|uniref:hypothetical protein n=1 Tax=Siphonobacter sp. SORGH_AS_1065 TaxID=3041795 RepID=UPI00277EFAF3|nr:hypothetical protein [Siphonobacter sp. SORGH_AS_1065]MDQ1089021.1 hypothetical protein [Siphonobacter sp. SORGH_AS_1065]
MSFPTFVAFPGDAVIVRSKKGNYPGTVKYATGGGITGSEPKKRYVVTIYGHDLEVEESQIDNALVNG